MIGQIARIKETDNYGFIKPIPSGEDHFFHESGCKEFEQIKYDFLQGDNIKVEFDSVEGRQGKMRAENVRRIWD